MASFKIHTEIRKRYLVCRRINC